MFGTSGIRGPVGETVTAEVALRLGRAVGADPTCETAVVGRDPRTTGDLLCAALSAGLRETGVDVIDLGLAATPTIARAVGWQDADVGIAVTASHNPPADNGFKLWTPSGQAFDEAQRAAVTERFEAEAAPLVAWDEVGDRRKWGDAAARHVETLVEGIDTPLEVSVVVDLGNGAGGVTVDALLEAGCSVTTLNATPDGRFPGRASEPTADSLAGLQAHVAATDAELGLAHDGDADRLLAVDETGSFVAGDELLAVFAREAASAGDQVAAPLNTSLLVDDALAAVDASVTRTKVGDVYVAEAAAREGVVFGGEPSGAWIWPDATLCPDGPLAAVKLAALVAAEGPLSAVRETLGEYPLRRESIAVEDKTAVFECVRGRVLDAYADVQTLDGVRVATDRGWFLIRPSGTQSLLRVTAEARTEEDCADLFEEAMEYVRACQATESE